MPGDYQRPQMMEQTPAQSAAVSPEWAIVILSSGEQITTLTSTIDSAIVACGDRPAVIDVLVNGNPLLADCIARSVERFAQRGRQTAQLRIWSAPVPDKAHGWNLYVHHMWPEAALTFFADGGASARLQNLPRMAETIGQAPILAEGTGPYTIQAIDDATLRDFRKRHFRLPLGLLCGTAAIGMAVRPEAGRWSSSVSEQVPGNLMGTVRRLLSEARTALEDKALCQHFMNGQDETEDFPATADEMITNWIRDFPDEVRPLFRSRPLCRWEARRARRQRDWSQADTDPEIIAESALGQPAL